MMEIMDRFDEFREWLSMWEQIPLELHPQGRPGFNPSLVDVADRYRSAGVAVKAAKDGSFSGEHERAVLEFARFWRDIGGLAGEWEVVVLLRALRSYGVPIAL